MISSTWLPGCQAVSSAVPLTRNLHIEKNLKKSGQSLNLEVGALKDKDAQVPCVVLLSDILSISMLRTDLHPISGLLASVLK